MRLSRLLVSAFSGPNALTDEGRPMFHDYLTAGYKRKSLLAVLALTVFAIAWPTCCVAIEREIAWTEDYEAAVQRAATTNSIVLLHFYGDYCPPCKLLDKKTFHDPALVSKMNECLVPVKINADRRRDLAQKFQVTRWPTDVYLFPNGDEIYRGVSNSDPAVYCKTITRVALRHRDWTVERNSTARAKEKRQDHALASHSSHIQSDKPFYTGNSGHSVKTHSASWTNEPRVSQANVPPVAPPGSTVILNPFLDKEPVSPPTPLSPDPSTLPSVVRSNQSSAPTSSSFIPPVAANTIASHTGVPVRNVLAPSSLAPTQSHIATELHTAAQPQTAARPQAPTQPGLLPPNSLPQSVAPQSAQGGPLQQVYAETIGLNGFCPVTLIEAMGQGNNNGWVEGSRSFAVRHRGRVYNCASERARQTLLSNPDRYTPCLSGFDIVHFCKVGELHDGKCEFGCLQESANRVFLFETKANLDEFTRNSKHYSQLIDSADRERVANDSNGTLNR